MNVRAFRWVLTLDGVDASQGVAALGGLVGVVGLGYLGAWQLMLVVLLWVVFIGGRLFGPAMVEIWDERLGYNAAPRGEDGPWGVTNPWSDTKPWTSTPTSSGDPVDDKLTELTREVQSLRYEVMGLSEAVREMRR